MYYQRLGFVFSFIIHILFVGLIFCINKPVERESMTVVLEFNVSNIIKTGEHDVDNTKETAEDIMNEASVPAMVKQEAENTVQEEIPDEQDEIAKEETPLPNRAWQETKNTVEEKVFAKAAEVINEDKQSVVTTEQESGNTMDFNDGGQSGGVPRLDSVPHELEQSAENQYIKEHFDYINNIIHINITYPYKARKMSMEGKVVISFFVCQDGSVKDVKIEKSSGFSTLDNNAVKAVRKASPFPTPPVEVKILVPITYKLNA